MPGVEQVEVEINSIPSKSRQGSQTSMKEPSNYSNSSLQDLGERVGANLKAFLFGLTFFNCKQCRQHEKIICRIRLKTR